MVAALGVYISIDDMVKNDEDGTPTYIAACGEECGDIYMRLNLGVCTDTTEQCGRDAEWMASKLVAINGNLESHPGAGGLFGARANTAWRSFQSNCVYGAKDWDDTITLSIRGVAGEGDCRWVADTAIELTERFIGSMEEEGGTDNG